MYLFKVYLKSLLLFLVCLFFSCAGKHNVQIENLEIPIPHSWTTPFSDNQRITGEWWLAFQDTGLVSFLEDFKKNNSDIKTIYENKKLAKYSAKINSSSIFPIINMNARIDTNIQNLSGFGFASSFTSEDEDNENNKDEILSFGNTNTGINLTLQWEIDIWGRLINARKAAYKDYDAMVYDLSYLQFSTTVRSAQLYFLGKELAAQLKLAEDSYNSFVEIRGLVKDRYQKGLRSSLDYRLAETSVATSIVTIEKRKNLLKSTNRQLEVLIGQYPKGELIKDSELPEKMPEIAMGIPINLLERRPDIQSLLFKMESNNYQIAEAKRNLLPGVFLNGSAGTSAQNIKDAINKDFGVWNLGLNVAAPLFNGNVLKSAVKVQEASYEKSKQAFLKGVLTAFSEVEQELESSQSLKIQLNALQSALTQSEDAYNLSKERYDSGVTSLESVLNSQRQFNNIKSQFITIQRLVLDNRLSLILAIGGDTSMNNK